MGKPGKYKTFGSGMPITFEVEAVRVAGLSAWWWYENMRLETSLVSGQGVAGKRMITMMSPLIN
jgi:hypothetical protein